jgi:sensor histidine kinase YesM
MNATRKNGSWRMMAWLQVLLWVVFYLLLLLYTSHKWDHPVFGFYNATIATFSYVTACYVHAFSLLPTYWYKNRIREYFIYSLLFLASLIFCRMAIERAILLPLHQMFYAYSWAHISFTCITVLVAFLFGALLRVFLNYLNLLEVKKELQQKHAEAELDLLKAQVQPHFLFNTLNNIYSLAQSRSEKTADMIAKLSELMRYFIEEAPKQLLPLSTELQFLRNYVDLEQIRMLHPVQVDWELDEKAGCETVPPMLLMPFIENVFKHGIDKLKNHNHVQIHLRGINGQIVYRVSNLLLTESPRKEGSGLNNLKKRLELLYGDRFDLGSEKQNGYYIATLTIPSHAHNLPDR